jgi:glycosyltransferase involved in cell wall biosynthesis
MILRRGDPMADAYRAAGLEVIEVPLVPPRRALDWTKLARFFISFWPTVFHIIRAIRKFHADIVHVNTLNNLQGPIAAWLSRRPLVWHIREIGKGNLLDRAMLRLVSCLATRVVAISSAVQETVRHCGGRARTILNAVDLSEYADLPEPAGVRAALGIAPGQPLVTTVGRIEPWKGQHVLVEAVPFILERHPDARIAIVGAGAVNKPEYELSLKARCRELGVTGNVLFTGIRTDVPSILAASDVLVLPSATPEPFGRTVVEAMAAGCPVVATAAGGPLETVLDGETGFLVPPNDPRALAEKVSFLLAHPEQARTMGLEGRRQAFARFSLVRLVSDMGALFEEVAREG